VVSQAQPPLFSKCAVSQSRPRPNPGLAELRPISWRESVFVWSCPCIVFAGQSCHMLVSPNSGADAAALCCSAGESIWNRQPLRACVATHQGKISLLGP